MNKIVETKTCLRASWDWLFNFKLQHVHALFFLELVAEMDNVFLSWGNGEFYVIKNVTKGSANVSAYKSDFARYWSKLTGIVSFICRK